MDSVNVVRESNDEAPPSFVNIRWNHETLGDLPNILTTTDHHLSSKNSPSIAQLFSYHRQLIDHISARFSSLNTAHKINIQHCYKSKRFSNSKHMEIKTLNKAKKKHHCTLNER